MKFKEKLQNQRIQARFIRDAKKRGIAIELSDHKEYPFIQYSSILKDEISLETTYSDQESIH